MGSNAFRVGVVGCGYWGEKHVRVMSGLAQVDAVVAIDPRSGVLDALATAYPAIGVAPSLPAALDRVEAVIIATPPASHCDLALEAIAAGKHVFIEKPITRSVAEADLVIGAARRQGVTLAAGHTFVHNAAVHKLVELVDEGALGKLHHIAALRLNLGQYRDDVNVIWDLAAHDISITLAIMGRTPDAVAAWGMRHTSAYGEDVASLRLSYHEENVDSIIRVSWLDPLKVRTTTLVGSDKMAIYDDIAADERIKILDRGRERRDSDDRMAQLAYRYGDILSPWIDFREPLRVQAEDFVAACLTGAEPSVTGDDGRRVVAVLEASDESLRRNGEPVTLVDTRTPELVGAGTDASFAGIATPGFRP